MKLLEGKTALITGASRGIGKAVALAFAKEGANIAFTDLRYDEIAQATEKEIAECGVKAKMYASNAADFAQTVATVDEIVKEFGRIDVLVNNAGIMKDALIGMINGKLMQEIFEVNVFAMIQMIQMANKLMSRQKSGSIINMASIVGTNGNSGQLVYSASKGAVVAMTKTAAKELASDNIRVNAIAPGMIDTDMFRSIGETKIQENLEKIKMGRLGNPEEIANACVFLASDLSAYISGQVLGVDGVTVI